MLNNKKISIFIIVSVLIAMTLFFVNRKPTNIEIKPLIQISFEQCQAQSEKCRLDLDDLSIVVSLDNNIEYLKPFNVRVWLTSKESTAIESVYIDFKMNNMNMGINRFSLIKNKVNNEKPSQLWAGEVVLPICVTGRADWLSELEVITKNKKYILSFPIQVKNTTG